MLIWDTILALGGTDEDHENLGRDLNCGPPEYEAEMLPLDLGVNTKNCVDVT